MQICLPNLWEQLQIGKSAEPQNTKLNDIISVLIWLVMMDVCRLLTVTDLPRSPVVLWCGDSILGSGWMYVRYLSTFLGFSVPKKWNYPIVFPSAVDEHMAYKKYSNMTT